MRLTPALYNLSSKVCLVCQNTIPFKKRINKFCSHSCSASVTNKQRGNHSVETKNKIGASGKAYFDKVGRKVKLIRTCKLCTNTVDKNHWYCKDCKPNLLMYRKRADFSFDVFKYPNEFDLHLILNLGWYSSNGRHCKNKKVNHSGVSRDHMYSVSNGYKNNKDPEILAHPANCKIMVHNGPNGNNSKNGKSSLTWDELLVRVKEWNKKYDDLAEK